MPRLLFINRSYWLDAEAKRQLLTELCEDLAGSFDVTVIAGQPNHNPEEISFARRGRHFFAVLTSLMSIAFSLRGDPNA